MGPDNYKKPNRPSRRIIFTKYLFHSISSSVKKLMTLSKMDANMIRPQYDLGNAELYRDPLKKFALS